MSIDQPRIIVTGNVKGGTGKSTVSLHMATALARSGYRTGVLDLDLGQTTVARFLENRAGFCVRSGVDLPTPVLVPADEDAPDVVVAALADPAVAALDALVIDTPGAATPQMMAAHAHADVLITPLNDSFVDLDVLVRMDHDGETVLGPSSYAQMVWQARQARAKAGGPPINWFVLRNRLAHVQARNQQAMETALASMARRFSFTVVPGLGERVIYREMFLKGLTLLDLRDESAGQRLSLSHVAARSELRALLTSIFPALTGFGDEDGPAQEGAA